MILNIFPSASVNHCHYQYGQKFTISASQTLNTVLAERIDINSVSQLGCSFFIFKAHRSSSSPVAPAAAAESWLTSVIRLGLLTIGTTILHAKFKLFQKAKKLLLTSWSSSLRSCQSYSGI